MFAYLDEIHEFIVGGKWRYDFLVCANCLSWIRVNSHRRRDEYSLFSTNSFPINADRELSSGGQMCKGSSLP